MTTAWVRRVVARILDLEGCSLGCIRLQAAELMAAKLESMAQQSKPKSVAAFAAGVTAGRAAGAMAVEAAPLVRLVGCPR